MRTADTKTFVSGNSEAVRLPKGIGYGPDVELTLERVGEIVTLRPKRRPSSGADLVAALAALPKPDEPWVREEIEIPARPGLYD